MGWAETGQSGHPYIGHARLTLLQGGEKYQQAFYVYEELAQAPSTSSIQTLVSQAVCELHLGRLEEAQAALKQAIEKDPSYVEAIANTLVLKVISGEDSTELTGYGQNFDLLSSELTFFKNTQEGRPPTPASH